MIARTCLAALAAALILASPAEARGRRPDRAPKVGAPAPDFELRVLDHNKPGKKKVSLRGLRGKRPVVLIFGSYTWPPFRRQAGALARLYETYKDQAQFFLVYIREAHPVDGRHPDWRINVKNPKTLKERSEVASVCVQTLDLPLPTLLDNMDNKVGLDYDAWPDRMFVVGPGGRIAWKSGHGPWGFRTADLERALKAELRVKKVLR